MRPENHPSHCITIIIIIIIIGTSIIIIAMHFWYPLTVFIYSIVLYYSGRRAGTWKQYSCELDQRLVETLCQELEGQIGPEDSAVFPGSMRPGSPPSHDTPPTEKIQCN